MTVKQALLYTFSLGAICVFLTWYLGHIWVFIMIVSAALVGIAFTVSTACPKSDQDQSENEKR
ncbi:hypothetical protein [Alkalimarinus alittae]|uniref:Uncharacterized protein n=1 Tax=Alkalimarinus alittae TaxID=2961619 RepID=A0ABY6N3X7_9ALTE|nr:hypothetical protein [Alkalimarinus alittae]UZE96697.1 hypothetical protein NKI27_02785 [Alkalimarinus alittae]